MFVLSKISLRKTNLLKINCPDVDKFNAAYIIYFRHQLSIHRVFEKYVVIFKNNDLLLETAGKESCV